MYNNEGASGVDCRAKLPDLDITLAQLGGKLIGD